MEVALEMEDDLFFADLSKQISLLIMEEDDIIDVGVPEDQEPVIAPYWHYSNSSLQGYSSSVNQPSAAASPLSAYEQIGCGREVSKGTGVFIPKSSQPRRKNRQGRFRPSPRSQSQRQSTNDHHQYHHNGLNRSETSQFISHKNSFHPKKF